MELYEVMRTTAATRQFTDDALPDEALETILDNARFAPSGGNRQGVRIIVIRDRATRERLVDLSATGARRYAAQAARGEAPWNTVVATEAGVDEIAATVPPAGLTQPLLDAAVVLVVAVDLSVVASMDQDLDRIGVISGASVYPMVWNILLAARNEGFGGTITTMLAAEEVAVAELLGLPPSYAVAAVLPLGRPVRQPTRLRRRPVAEFVTRERFDGVPFGPTSD